MSKKRSVKEILKTCLIVLLSVSAVFLAARTRLFDEFFASVPLFEHIGGLLSGEGPSDAGSSVTFSAASRPTAVVVTGSGGRCSADPAELYERAGPLLGEALGSSHEPEGISEADWRAALSSASVYFEYPDPVRLGVLAGWFGSELSGPGAEMRVRRLVVSAGTDGPVLCYIDEDTGGFFRCSTAASAAALEALVSSSLPNGASFVFELDLPYGSVDPYMLVTDGPLSAPVLSVSMQDASSVGENGLLECFGINPYISSKYPEQSGDTVYVEGDASLRSGPDGSLYFRQSTDGGRLPVASSGSVATEAEAIEAARAFLSGIAALTGGDAEELLSSCEGSDGTYTVSFSRFVSGLRIYLPDGAASAEIVVSGGVISEARLMLRRYALSGETVSLLRPLQEAAVIGASGLESAAPGWSDALASDTLTPEWLSTGGE